MMIIDLQIWKSKIKDQDQFQKIISSDLDRTKDQDQLGDLRSLRSRSMIFLQLCVSVDFEESKSKVSKSLDLNCLKLHIIISFRDKFLV